MSEPVLDPYSLILRFVGRYLKPNFQYQSIKSLIVPATSKTPAYFIIGNKIYLSTKNIECNLIGSGLATGLTLAASTVYYLYAILISDNVSLVADTNDPTVGPRQYKIWTYLGAFVTTSGTNVMEFVSNNGFCLCDDEIQIVTHTGDTNFSATTLNPFPITAKMVYGLAGITGAAGTGGLISASGTSGHQALTVINEVAAGTAYNTGFIPILTTNTIYIKTQSAAGTVEFDSLGWVENPSEYP